MVKSTFCTGSTSDTEYETELFHTFTATESFIRSQPSNCVICMDGFEPGTDVKQLIACRHYFHRDCICQWLSGSITCPICRSYVWWSSDHSWIVPDGRPKPLDLPLGFPEQPNPIRSGSTTVSLGEVRRPICLWFCQLIDLFEALFLNRSD
ncbi:hypothetical protein OSB04_010269 [Centaurea solstitialis]|uniref:RING-type E3 ubiquitin transferase n=1 Tax=Centaurea solstitialis TaxID=347529 RepID=A0AA38TJ07_9ASTR|nr:hypothetical protein OSB04_010269 [Centaurea solstitialis]